MQEGDESPESWESILMGLAELCMGLSPALESEEDEDVFPDIYDSDDLCRLQEMAPSTRANAAILSIAAALPSSCASAAVYERSTQNLKLTNSYTP